MPTADKHAIHTQKRACTRTHTEKHTFLAPLSQHTHIHTHLLCLSRTRTLQQAQTDTFMCSLSSTHTLSPESTSCSVTVDCGTMCSHGAAGPPRLKKTKKKKKTSSVGGSECHESLIFFSLRKISPCPSVHPCKTLKNPLHNQSFNTEGPERQREWVNKCVR